MAERAINGGYHDRYKDYTAFSNTYQRGRAHNREEALPSSLTQRPPGRVWLPIFGSKVLN